MDALLSIAIALIAGLLLSRLAKLLKLPAVTAYLVAGILVGPYVLGAFGNAETGKETQIPLNEVEGLPVGNYAVYSSKQGFVGVKTEKDSVPCALTQLEAEVFTIVKIENGKAVIGDIDKLNPSAYIGEKGKVAVYTEERGFEIIAE